MFQVTRSSLFARLQPQSKDACQDLHPQQLQGLSLKLASWTPPTASRLGRTSTSQPSIVPAPRPNSSNLHHATPRHMPSAPAPTPSSARGAAAVSTHHVACHILSKGAAGRSPATLFHHSPAPLDLHPLLLLEQQQHLHHKLQLIRSRRSPRSSSGASRLRTTSTPASHQAPVPPAPIRSVQPAPAASAPTRSCAVTRPPTPSSSSSSCGAADVKGRAYGGQVARRLLTKGLYVYPDGAAVELHPSFLCRRPRQHLGRSPLSRSSAPSTADGLLVSCTRRC